MSLSNPEYGIVDDEDVMAPMRDGVRLATDIYRPARDGVALPGPLPTILGRTSYDKRWRELWIDPVARYFGPGATWSCCRTSGDAAGRRVSASTSTPPTSARARTGTTPWSG